MPASKNPQNYPHICWEVLRVFEERLRTELVLDGQDYRTTDAPWPPEMARKKAKQIQLTLTGFRQALRSSGHGGAFILDGVEFTFQETPSGGTCTVRTKDTNGFTNAVRMALNRAGLSSNSNLPVSGMQIAQDAHLGDTSRPNAFVGSPTEPQQKPWDYRPIEATLVVDPKEAEALIMRDGMKAMKKFEDALEKLGFGTGPEALKPPQEKQASEPEPNPLPKADGSI